MPTDYQIFTSAPFLIIWHLPTAAEQHNRSALPVLIALSLLLFPPAGMPRGQQKKREMSSRLSTYFCPLLPPSWKREIAPTARTGTMVGTLFPTLPACLASQVQGSSAPLLFFSHSLHAPHTTAKAHVRSRTSRRNRVETVDAHANLERKSETQGVRLRTRLRRVKRGTKEF